MDRNQKDEMLPSDLELNRLAKLVATGSVDLPTSLPESGLIEIARRVREHRRQFLVRHVARCIAAEISTTSQNPGEHKIND